MRSFSALLGVAVLAAGASAGWAGTLNVGPARTYTSIQAAIDAAASGDTILVDSGTYVGTNCTMLFNGKSNITVKGNGPTRPVLDMGPDHSVSIWGKGICTVTSASGNITFEFLEFVRGAGRDLPPWNDTGHNGAAIRYDGSGLLTIRHCYIHDCEDGILATSLLPYEVLIEYSEFNHNGYGQGSTHNMYLNHAESFTLRHCYIHRAKAGHEVKSRAKRNYILYNRIMNEDGNGSYEVDIPNGGETYIIGNIIQQGPDTTNRGMIQFAEEGNANGGLNPDQHLYIINNTIANERNNGTTFVNNASTTSAVLANNLFLGEMEGNTDVILTGPGTEMFDVLCNVHYNNGGTTHGPSAWLVSPGAPDYDYRLTPQSVVALNAGWAPGTSFNGYSLAPIYQYVHPYSHQNRPSDSRIDIGAYEYSTNPTVEAGAGQVTYEGLTVRLNAFGADPNDSPLSYAWVQIAGKTVAFSNPNRSDTSFIAPTVATKAEAALAFKVAVNNGAGGTANDSVSVRVYMAGDANRDDAVNIFDLLLLASAWNSVAGNPAFDVACDFNADQAVNIFDLLTLAGRWNQSLP